MGLRSRAILQQPGVDKRILQQDCSLLILPRGKATVQLVFLS